MPSQTIKKVEERLHQLIPGQERLINRMLVCLVAQGHLLIEGLPGLAKTRAVKSLASVVKLDFKRIQFTPDLLPADITGTDIYNQAKKEFTFMPGPLFNHLVLADEINRSPAKVQSALLEAMGEGQITIGQETRRLEQPFMVLATQNPIEQDGTYELPEAQLDRFLLHTKVDYPSYEIEKEIINIVRLEQKEETKSLPKPLATIDDILKWRKSISQIHVDESLTDYIVRLVRATRGEVDDENLQKWISVGAGPRACISLDLCARALAFFDSRDYVKPDDIIDLIHDTLRHRIILSFDSEVDGVDKNKVLQHLVDVVPIH